MPGTRELSDFVAIGQILKPHGVKGALRVRPFTDDAERFSLMNRIYLTHNEVTRTAFTVCRTKPSNRFIILSLKEINSVESAEEWREAFIEIPRSECPPLTEGVHYYFELIGLIVYSNRGDRIGELVDVYTTAASDIYVIRNQNREILIPAVPEFIERIDVDEGVMIIRPIDGLLDS